MRFEISHSVPQDASWNLEGFFFFLSFKLLISTVILYSGALRAWFDLTSSSKRNYSGVALVVLKVLFFFSPPVYVQ